ncbi:hypothetical protein HK102_011489, partial [Quaeritorhiza haematococci]
MTSQDQVAMSSSRLMFVMLRVQPSPNPIKVMVMVTERQGPSQSQHLDEQQTHDQQTLHLVKDVIDWQKTLTKLAAGDIQ